MITSSAQLSPCSRYRYELRRVWQHGRPLALFVLCNPSTADATEDDATVRRCVGFARRFGCGGLIVVNVCAWRATKPRNMIWIDDPVGPMNKEAIEQALLESAGGPIVLGWGDALPKKLRHLGMRVARLIEDAGRMPLCFGTTKEGQPKHPLRLATNEPIELFRVLRPKEENAQ